MREECIAQATRLTGSPERDIVAANPIEAGPDRRAFIGLTVNGASYGCRIEDDGRYLAKPMLGCKIGHRGKGVLHVLQTDEIFFDKVAV